LPEGVGVIYDGRDEIDGLDDRQLIVQLIDPGIISSLQADEQVGVIDQGQPA